MAYKDYNSSGRYASIIDEDKWKNFNNFQKGWLNADASNQTDLGLSMSTWEPGEVSSFMDQSNDGSFDKLMGGYNSDSDWGFNKSTFDTVGNVAGGFGKLAQAWAGLQNVKLGREELSSQKEQWNKNYASQATTVNNQISDQNAWKAAQGRTDFGNKVKTYLG